MAAEHDHSLLTTVADWLWAAILVVLGGVTRWIYAHEQRVTRLEAQHEECQRARERADEALHDMRAEMKLVNSKLDRILGRLDPRPDEGGQ